MNNSEISSDTSDDSNVSSAESDIFIRQPSGGTVDNYQKQLEEQHKKHQAELAEMMKNYEANAQAALKESENSLKAEIKALNKQLEEAKAEKIKLEEKIVEIEKLRKEQEETVAKCEKQREELDQLKADGKIREEEYQNRLNIIENDRKKAQQDLDQTMASLGAYKRQLDEQKEKEKNLNEEIKKGQEGLISLKDKLGETSQKLNDLANKYNVNVSVPDFSSYHDTDSESDIEPPKVPLQNNQNFFPEVGKNKILQEEEETHTLHPVAKTKYAISSDQELILVLTNLIASIDNMPY
ncbi:22739_t:CDS:2, partial [Dentiscutata erythropus]